MQMPTSLRLVREELLLLVLSAIVLASLTYVNGHLAYNGTECVTISIASGFSDQRDVKINLPPSSGVHDSVRLGKDTFQPEDYAVRGNYLKAVFSAMADDNGNAPFYYACLATWVRILDFTPLSFRLFNIAITLLSSIAAYRAALAFGIPKPAPIIAGLLVTFGGNNLEWMLYLREYNLSFLLSFLSLLCLRIVMVQGRKSGYLLLGICLGLQLLTHYFSVGFVTITLAFLWLFRPHHRGYIFAAAGIAAMLLSAWLLTSYAHDGLVISNACAEHLRAAQAISSSGALAHATFEKVLKEAIRQPFWMCGSQLELFGFRVMTSLILGFPLVAVALMGSIDILKRELIPGIALCLLSCTGIVVSGLASFRAGNVYPLMPIYQVFYSPVWILFLAAGLGLILRRDVLLLETGRMRWLSLAIGLAAMLILLASFARASQRWFERGINAQHVVAEGIRQRGRACEVVYGNWSDAQLVSLELLHCESAKISQRVTPGHRDKVYLDMPNNGRKIFPVLHDAGELYWVDSPLYTPKE